MKRKGDEMKYSDQRGIIHNTDGGLSPRCRAQERAVSRPNTDWEDTSLEEGHFGQGMTYKELVARWLALGTFAERNPKKEKQCQSRESLEPRHATLNTGGVVEKRTGDGRSGIIETTSGTGSKTSTLPSSPPESESPESRGWVPIKLKHEWVEYFGKNDYRVCYDGAFWWGFKPGESCCLKEDKRETWQQIDDLLFPKAPRPLLEGAKVGSAWITRDKKKAILTAGNVMVCRGKWYLVSANGRYEKTVECAGDIVGPWTEPDERIDK